jgi:hypothetical protein
MKTRLVLLFSVAVLSILAIGVTAAAAKTKPTAGAQAPLLMLYRCATDYSDDELATIQANNEDGYEPDDCPLLAHKLTGPERHTFCQPGDEDWDKIQAKQNLIYQITAAPQPNYPTEPHLDLYEEDGTLIKQNDHYFGNNAEIWWWNTGPDRTVYIRATEARGRADCGNTVYTLSVHSFTENPYPPTAQPTGTVADTPAAPVTDTPTVTTTLTLTVTQTLMPTLALTQTVLPEATSILTPTETLLPDTTPTAVVTPTP